MSSNIFVEGASVSRTKVKREIISQKLIPYCCEQCEMKGHWNGKKLVLQLDHINGIRNDNRLQNLRFLCPNCHSQQETTYKRKNKPTKLKLINEDEILLLYEKFGSIRQVLFNLGFSDASANYKAITNVLKRHGVYKDGQRIKAVGKMVNGRRYSPRPAGRKVDRPQKEDLYRMIWERSTSEIAKELGVSDKAISKWCEIYEIEKPPRGYWSKRRAGKI